MEASEPRKRTGQPIQIYLQQGDKEILLWLAEFLGTSQADVMRTSLRAFAYQMRGVAKTLGDRDA